MERLERRPKNGDGTKVYVTFRATGWRGVENALLTSSIQATPYKQNNNMFRGQLKVLTDHTGAEFASPIAVNGPQGATKAEALHKLEAHYGTLAAWVSTEYGDGDEDVAAPPKFIQNYKAAFNRVAGGEAPPVKRRKLNATVAVEEEPVLSISEQAMKLAMDALLVAMRAKPPLAPPVAPSRIRATEPLAPSPPVARMTWLPPLPLPPPAAPAVRAEVVEKPYVAAQSLVELDARIAEREKLLYEPFGRDEDASLSSSQTAEFLMLFS